jgi:hypothetical protein
MHVCFQVVTMSQYFLTLVFSIQIKRSVPGLEKKEERCNLLSSKRWHIILPFFTNEPGTGRRLEDSSEYSFSFTWPLG